MASAIRRNKLTEVIWSVHRFLYRVSGGRIGGSAVGLPVLMLTTKGRKSGEPRTSVLTYLPKGRAAVVFASNAGEPKHPAWWLNLVADPHAQVQIGRDVTPMSAREADGAERQQLWAELVRASPSYAEYEQRTTRRIPVVVLEPGH
ncbi:MAG: nitroreductase family deazaflavin-dependent oxidoreductase [Candidatus Binatia bacterium]